MTGLVPGPDGMAVPAPFGVLRLRAEPRGLTHVLLPDVGPRGVRGRTGKPGPAGPATGVGSSSGTGPAQDHLLAAATQLAEYFAGTRTAFDVPLAPSGTPFQLAVWRALAGIPYGETITYAELARRVGRPTAYRAAGQANGANPLAIVVPCHRVVAAGGRIGGYAGGVTVKRRLLALEGLDGDGWR